MGSKEGPAHRWFFFSYECLQATVFHQKWSSTFTCLYVISTFFTTEDEADWKLKNIKNAESDQKSSSRPPALCKMLDRAVWEKNWGIKVKCFGTRDEAFKREWLPSLAMLLFNWGLVEPTGPRCLRHLITTPRPFALHSGPAASAAAERCSLYSLPPRSLPGIWS